MCIIFVFIPFNVFFPGYHGGQKKNKKTKRTRAPNLHGQAINFNFLLFPGFR